MRRFGLLRQADISGVSGTGLVCEGMQFTDGTVVLHWLGDLRSTAVYANIMDVEAIHGHNGSTVVAWIDTEDTE